MTLTSSNVDVSLERGNGFDFLCESPHPISLHPSPQRKFPDPDPTACAAHRWRLVGDFRKLGRSNKVLIPDS
eukprot:1317179-Amorphochlora_amoeboformis.AAC.2